MACCSYQFRILPLIRPHSVPCFQLWLLGNLNLIDLIRFHIAPLLDSSLPSPLGSSRQHLLGSSLPQTLVFWLPFVAFVPLFNRYTGLFWHLVFTLLFRSGSLSRKFTRPGCARNSSKLANACMGGDVLLHMGKLPICNSSVIVSALMADVGQGLVIIGFCSVILFDLDLPVDLMGLSVHHTVHFVVPLS